MKFSCEHDFLWDGYMGTVGSELRVKQGQRSRTSCWRKENPSKKRGQLSSLSSIIQSLGMQKI